MAMRPGHTIPVNGYQELVVAPGQHEPDQDSPATEPCEAKNDRQDADLDDLPLEVLINIVSRLPIEDRFAILCTSKKLRQVGLMPDLWKSVCLPYRLICSSTRHAKSTPKTLSRLAWLLPTIGCHVQTLNANGTGSYFADGHLTHFGRHCQNLVTVNLSGSEVTGTGIKALLLSILKQPQNPLNPAPGHMPGPNIPPQRRPGTQISRLLLGNIGGLDDASLVLISDTCPLLQTLDISSFTAKSKLSDVGISAVSARCSSLSVLIMVGCHMVTDRSLVHIGSSLPRLTHLDCVGCFQIGDAGARSVLMGCPKIRLLDFSYCWRITDRAFEDALDAGLSAGGELASVNLQFCYQLTDLAALYLSRLRSLVCANFSYCSNITARGRAMLCDAQIVGVFDGVQLEPE
ncbi:uncharacterized protein BJ171DRAFT_620826 [Polychytrium aggregatum]|uniref:uncharacterized protein n=1 Tax=Polychytrium aggregatum TaxID=110093 RepID=UPI0022FF2BF5|nr:uncharacterized protein BJ171DRAFT_620826 [Polychytrium aggregatum]KAI9209418.1 hypothetical protein BJ171DRAFT_620826 [Polychytrium aggregatum]